MTIELKTRDAVSLAAHLAQRLPHLEVLHAIDLAAYAHDGVSNPLGMTSYYDHLVGEVLPHESAFIVKASDLVDNAGSLKHMAPSARRIKLANKYLEPVNVMISGVGVVTNLSHGGASVNVLSSL